MRNYDDLTSIQQKLLDQNIIDLVGEVDERMAFYVREAIIRLISKIDNGKYPAVKIFITSYGGDCEHGLNIYDTIMNYPGETTGIIQHVSNSMAAIILQACDHRLCMENSSMFIHNPIHKKLEWETTKNKKKMNQIQTIFNEIRNRLLKIWSKRSGQSFRTIAKICAKNKPLTAIEARKLNLIDEIMVPAKKSKKK